MANRFILLLALTVAVGFISARHFESDPESEALVADYSITQDDVNCIIMKASITLVIKYNVTTSEKPKTATVGINRRDGVTGSCKEDHGTQFLVIKFRKGWELTFTFSKHNNTVKRFPEDSPNKEIQEPFYRISNITLLYVVDKTIFPDHKIGEGAKVLEVASSQKTDFPQKSAGMDYYRCNNETKNVLNENVEVRTKSLKFRAFSLQPETKYDGKEDVCSRDVQPGPEPKPHNKEGKMLKTGVIVGLVVAISLVLAISVLVFVLLKRRRRHGYIQ